MERMVEQDIDSEIEYHQYYHFLSKSKWDYHSINLCTLFQTREIMAQIKLEKNTPTGLIIDESATLKTEPKLEPYQVRGWLAWHHHQKTITLLHNQMIKRHKNRKKKLKSIIKTKMLKVCL